MLSNQEFFRSLYRIRKFEETVIDNFYRGLFFGTTHTCLGQEGNAVGVLANIQEVDIVFSSHRGHGHFLAYGGDARTLFAELMGRATGVCGGRGGSQHLHWHNFYSNGIQGGIIPISTGMALAEKYKHSGAITVAFLGDGTLGEGVIYEAFNMASLWKAPILYVLENNGIAQTTPVQLSVAGDMKKRFDAFDIACTEIETSDVQVISESAESLLAKVRQEQTPHALIINTKRFGPHSKGDDTRSPEYLDQIRTKYDPVRIQSYRLDSREKASIEAQVNDEINIAFETASKDPFPVL